MSTQWEHQVFVICAAPAIGGAIAALDIAFPRDDGKPRDQANPGALACNLTAQDGSIFYGASFSVTEQIRETLEGMGLAQTPGILYWRCSNPEGILTTTNHSASIASIGQPWAWEQCKLALGLIQL